MAHGVANLYDFNLTNFTNDRRGLAPFTNNASTSVGLVALFISVVGFGCNLIPVKAYHMGDGFFFQWVLGTSILLSGFVFNCIIRFTTFYCLAMLGGFMWATAALCIVPIFQTIGIGLGVLIWGTFNILTAWASGRFGMLEVKSQFERNICLNYAGVSVCLISAIIYFFIKPDIRPVQEPRHCHQPETSYDNLFDSNEVDETHPLINNDTAFDSNRSFSIFENMNTSKKRMIGICLSVISGILYGLSFTPIYYVMSNYKKASKRGIHYIFAHCGGIGLTANIYFLSYLLYKRKRAFINKKCIVPICVSGIIWAICDGAWLIANEGLTEAVTFPILVSSPIALNALWGVIVYKEIKGKRNFILLGIGLLMTASGVIMTAVSKIVKS